MASFGSAFRAVECAIAIQRKLADHNLENAEEAIAIRTGVSAGEPVTESGDLFGACVQLAARLCARSRPGTILVSTAIYDLALGHHFAFGGRRRLTLRGFDQPIHAYEVEWQPVPVPRHSQSPGGPQMMWHALLGSKRPPPRRKSQGSEAARSRRQVGCSR